MRHNVSPAELFSIVFSGINDETLTFMDSVWYFSETAAQNEAPNWLDLLWCDV